VTPLNHLDDDVSPGPAPPFDLAALKTCPLHTRPSKVSHTDLGRTLPANADFGTFLASLPKQLAADSLRRLVGNLVQVHRERRVAVAAIGGHVVKTGCGPYLVDLIHRGVLSGVAMNGAAAIHDLELALAGKTSEDVGPRLVDGTFGMACETADLYAHAAHVGSRRQIGLGRALGACLSNLDCPHAECSILVQAYRADVPCTVHVALGTDVVHMHPQMSGADLGEASMVDFRILTTLVSRMEAGLWMNIGCAVVMPEVFLKAVSIVRNHGYSLDGLVTANLDMIQQYRGRVNVCQRPSEEGIGLTGHHEIMIPLIHAAVVAEMAAAGDEPIARAA
jgi:hypothetical protein